MPSHYEPCGTIQLIAMRYGTIPIVRATGGLKDTVVDYTEDLENGFGFKFKPLNCWVMLYCSRQALAVYGKKRSGKALYVEQCKCLSHEKY
ncbi:hypothetical protein [Cellulosilyticum ruminicola]|uniref:hypothetical protein n=1 Tax=Cellulosilyticum ruminicola TaxID=425254 RepID=UPI0006D25F3C|nr:hypothetical protein [Cellulosilyticum ruminicola]